MTRTSQKPNFKKIEKTIYRTFGYKLQIGLGNWDLSEKVMMNDTLSRNM